MPQEYTRPRRIPVRKRRSAGAKLNPNVALELDVAGMHGLCFDLGMARMLPVADTIDVVADLVPIAFPPGLRRVPNPLGGQADHYNGSDFMPVILQPGRSLTHSSLVLNGMRQWASTKAGVRARAEDQSLAVRHHCGHHDRSQLRGARACATGLFLVNSPDTAPITFHLKGEFEELHYIDMREFGAAEDATELDHFLLPSMLPNETIVWLAFPRKNSPHQNRATLLQWRTDTYDYASFTGRMLFLDSIGITLAFGAVPAHRS